jgi:hypothetical protein
MRRVKRRLFVIPFPAKHKKGRNVLIPNVAKPSYHGATSIIAFTAS